MGWYEETDWNEKKHIGWNEEIDWNERKELQLD
jgi:hypothetical protein